MTLPIEVNFPKRRRGDTKPFILDLTDLATAEAINLAGFSALMTVDPNKAPPDNTTNAFQVAGITAVAGIYTFTPTPAQVDLLAKFFYDVQIIDPNGVITTAAFGTITFIQDITKNEV